MPLGQLGGRQAAQSKRRSLPLVPVFISGLFASASGLQAIFIGL
jgi:hypothetical protein